MVDGYKFANLVNTRSLAKGGLDDVPAIIAAAAKGDVQPAANAIAAAGQPQPSLVVGFGLALGVFCRESVAYTTPEDVLAAAKKANPTFPEDVLQFTPQSPRFFADCGRLERGQGSGAEPAAGPERHPDPDPRRGTGRHHRTRPTPSSPRRPCRTQAC